METSLERRILLASRNAEVDSNLNRSSSAQACFRAIGRRLYNLRRGEQWYWRTMGAGGCEKDGGGLPSRDIIRDAEAEVATYGTPGFYLSPTQPCRVGLTSVAPTALHVGRAREGGAAAIEKPSAGWK